MEEVLSKIELIELKYSSKVTKETISGSRKWRRTVMVTKTQREY